MPFSIHLLLCHVNSSPINRVLGNSPVLGAYTSNRLQCSKRALWKADVCYTLAGVNAPSLYAINHQPCKLHDSLLCMPSIKQQIMTNLRSPGTHLLAFPSSQNEMYHPFQGLGSPLPRRLQSCSSILYRFASSHQQCDDWQGAESLTTR